MVKSTFGDESFKLEYKIQISKTDRTWLKSVVAFSNSAGGEIIIGVEDKTLEVRGITEDRAIIEQRIIEMIHNNVIPKPVIDISFRNVGDRDIAIIFVMKGNQTPYYLKSEGVEKGCFVRYGSTDRLATESERLELTLSRRHSNFTNEVFEIDGKGVVVDEKEQSEFIDSLNGKITTNKLMSSQKFLEWALIKKINNTSYITNGYALLTNNPFGNSYIKIGVFEGPTKSSLKREIIINGSIINQFEEVMNHLLILLDDGFAISTKRIPKYKLPEVALREIMANAIVHRNYFENHPIRVSVFSDRIEVFSPGVFFDGLDLIDALSGISKLRNPNIAEVFYHLGIIEKWGSGIIRANEELMMHSKKPVAFEVSNHGINAVMYFQFAKEVISRELNVNNYLEHKSTFTRRDVEDDLGMTEYQARYYIEKWLKEDAIKREGETRRSIYVVIK